MVGIGEGFYRVFIHAGVGPAGPPARALRKKKCSWDPDMWERTGVYAAKEGGMS